MTVTTNNKTYEIKFVFEVPQGARVKVQMPEDNRPKLLKQPKKPGKPGRPKTKK